MEKPKLAVCCGTTYFEMDMYSHVLGLQAKIELVNYSIMVLDGILVMVMRHLVLFYAYSLDLIIFMSSL